MFEEAVVIRGAGDLGSGCALRLWRAGFRVMLLEAGSPAAVRRTVSFSEAVFDGSATVEGTRCVRAGDPDEAEAVLEGGEIPLLVDPDASSISSLHPSAVVDAILAKRNTGTRLDWAPLVIGLGPGFRVGRDAHCVVETNRGPDLGRVIWSGEAEANTGHPAAVAGRSAERVLRAPVSGTLEGGRAIGEVIDDGTVVCEVEGVPVLAPFRGLVRGLLRDGSRVAEGVKVGDLDPRLDASVLLRVSDKSLAVAGGVLEAVVGRLHGRLSL